MRADPLKKTPRKKKRFSQQRTAAPEKGVCREEKQTRQREKGVYRERETKLTRGVPAFCGARRQNEEDDNSGTAFVNYGRIGHTRFRNV